MTTVAAALVVASLELLAETGLGARMPATAACPYLLAIDRAAPELRARVDIPPATWAAWVELCSARIDRTKSTED